MRRFIFWSDKRYQNIWMWFGLSQFNTHSSNIVFQIDVLNNDVFYLGTARRHCLMDSSGGLPMAVWEQPDLSECVSPKFAKLYQQTKKLESLETVNTETVLNITSGKEA